jgi:hypothetical protein
MVMTPVFADLVHCLSDNLSDFWVVSGDGSDMLNVFAGF